MDSARIVVAGAGSIGCFVGGWLALAGRDVTLLLRPRLAERIAGAGLRLTDLDGHDRTVPANILKLDTEAATALANADVILVTVKSGDTAAMAELIAAYAPPAAQVVSLQNGVDNVPMLRERLASRTVIAGMVPFNVAQTLDDGAPRFHRSTAGTMLIDDGHEPIRALLDVDGLPCRAHPDMAALAWSKLVLNLNNALNALSGLPLREQLSRRPWRMLLAGQMREALAAIGKAGIRLPRIEGINPAVIPMVLRLPDGLFRLAARRMLAIDPEATSSMAEDLAAGRRTEVRYLQGAVSRLARAHGGDAPLADAVVAMVEECERAPQRWSADDVAARLRSGAIPRPS